MIQLLLYFPDQMDPVDVSSLVRANSFSVTRNLYNENCESVIDTCSVELKYDQLLVAQIMEIASNEKIVCRVYTSDENPLFFGYIAPALDVRKAKQVETISLEIRDASWKLDLPLKEDFQLPVSISDPPVTVRAAYEAILLAAGYDSSLIAADGLSAAETIQMVSVEAEKYTFRQLLDSLLRDHGYVFSIDGEGRFFLYQWNRDTYIPFAEIDQQISAVETFEISKEDSSYDGIKLTWAGLETLENVRLYTANLPVGVDKESSGVSILPDRYYPEDGDMIDTFQTYQTEWLDVAYQSRKTRVKNDDITLVTTENHRLSTLSDIGIAVDLQDFEKHQAQILLHNFTEEILKVYVLEIYGRALFRSSIRETLLPVGATDPKEESSEFVFSLEAAEKLASGLYRNQQFGNVQYRFTLRDKLVAVGDVVALRQSDPALDTLAVITSESWTDGVKSYRYTARGVSSFGGLQAITTAYQAAKAGKGEKGETGEAAISLIVVSAQGNIFRPTLTDTTLEARVYQEGAEITDQYAASQFRWTRSSLEPTADAIWNSAHYSVGSKSLHITDEDVESRATFFCELI
jgi:hypothetical protein